jgi:hypothetical protein
MTTAASFVTSTAGVVDTGGKLPLVSTTPAANLPPVTMTPVTNNGNCRTVLPDYIGWRAGTTTLCQSQLYPPVRD